MWFKKLWTCSFFSVLHFQNCIILCDCSLHPLLFLVLTIAAIFILYSLKMSLGSVWLFPTPLTFHMSIFSVYPLYFKSLVLFTVFPASVDSSPVLLLFVKHMSIYNFSMGILPAFTQSPSWNIRVWFWSVNFEACSWFYIRVWIF